MAYKLIQKFVAEMGGHEATIIPAAFSPLLLSVPWSTNPDIPLTQLLINRNRESVLVLDDYHYNLCCEDGFRKYVEKKVSIQGLEEAYATWEKEIQDIYDESIEIDFLSADESIIIDFLKKAIPVWERVDSTIYIELLNYEMALKVIGEGEKTMLDTVWEQATHPTFLSFEGRRLAYLLKLIKEVKDISLIIPRVRYIYTDYYWTKSDTEIRAALEEIKSHFSEKEEELEILKRNIAIKQSSHAAWEKSLTPEQQFLIDYIQMIMRLRDIRKDPIAQAQSVLILIATELLRRAGIDPTYGRVLNMYECVRGVAHLKNNRDEIMKRVEGNISMVNLDATIDIELCDYNKAVEEFYALTSKHSGDKATEIKGQIASKGKVIGIVRIVLDPQTYEGFTDGDILVTSMTRPEFVPLMKMAGAVVTNEGGITCHAAIVSRELGIPCVIGTKIATRVLHDGDLVEVDAEKGIVRILERK